LKKIVCTFYFYSLSVIPLSGGFLVMAGRILIGRKYSENHGIIAGKGEI